MLEPLWTVAVEFWGVLGEMAPYLLLGFLVAGLLSVFVSRDVVARHLGGRGIWSIIKATVFGIPLPLCSCGVIPVAASLRSHGASRGATTAFLLSTPQTGVDSILVTLSLLGPVFALFRPLVALAKGVFGGLIITAVEPRDTATGADTLVCDGPCCAGDDGKSKVVRALEFGFVTLPRDIAKSLLVGLVIAGVIAAAVPADFFGTVLGAGIVPMLVMMVVGLPVYVCATASVPVAAALIAKGVSPGAALVFLLTGPATNAAAVSIIWKIMGRRTAVTYLVIVAVAALGAGLLLDAIFAGTGSAAGPYMPYMLPGAAETASALFLLGVLAVALRPRRSADGSAGPTGTGKETVRFSIGGMTCSHCGESVEKALAACGGVETATVDVKGRQAIVIGTGLDLDTLRGAVERLGYQAGTTDCITTEERKEEEH